MAKKQQKATSSRQGQKERSRARKTTEAQKLSIQAETRSAPGAAPANHGNEGKPQRPSWAGAKRPSK